MSLTVRPIVGTRAKITALGTYVPPEIITNQDLEKLVDTNDQWILDRTGIRERHKLAKGLGVSDMAAEAAKNCLAARGIESFDPTGKPFDPHHHEAVMQEARDKHPPMTVTQNSELARLLAPISKKK